MSDPARAKIEGQINPCVTSLTSELFQRKVKKVSLAIFFLPLYWRAPRLKREVSVVLSKNLTYTFD